MLQVFYLDVAKLDRDVRYICKCFKCFQTYVTSVLSWCLHIFAMITHVLSSFLSGLQVFQMYVICVLACFVLTCKCFVRCYTCCNACEKRRGASGPCTRSGGTALCGHAKRMLKQCAGPSVWNKVQCGLSDTGVRPDVRALALQIYC
jgi:hypothetical protein